MNLVIDASNISGGGGAWHLRNLLRHAEHDDAFETMFVVGRPELASAWPDSWAAKVRLVRADVLSTVSSSDLAGADIPGYFMNRVRILRWRQRAFPELVRALHARVLFSPGGILPRVRIPGVATVAMSQNMLPFDAAESSRYGGLRRARLRAVRRAQLASFHRADGVIFVSRHAQRVIGALDPQIGGKAVCIPHGVDLAPPRTDYAPASPVVYVSTVDLYKHQWHVVRAIALLRDRHPSIRLRLAGGPTEPASTRLDQAIRSDQIGSSVDVLGALSRAGVDDELARAGVFVFASSCENCPFTLLEAMAAGLPIACSNRAPMPEFAQDGAVYFDPEDPASIASAVDALISDQDARRRLGMRSRELAAEKSWDTCAKETFRYLAGVTQRQTVPATG